MIHTRVRRFWELNDYDSDFMLGTSTWEFVDFIVIGIDGKKQCRIFGTQWIIFIASITEGAMRTGEHKYLSLSQETISKWKLILVCSTFKYISGRTINVMRFLTYDSISWFSFLINVAFLWLNNFYVKKRKFQGIYNYVLFFRSQSANHCNYHCQKDIFSMLIYSE